MRPNLILLLSLLGSCATAQAQPSSSWCFEEHEQGQRQEISSFTVAPVRSDRMADAINALRTRTVVALSAEEAESYLSGSTGLPPERHYLVRANVTTAREATLEEVIAAARGARYNLYWAEEDKSLALFVSQSVAGLRQQNNIALVLRTNLPVEKIYLGCFITD